MSPFAEVSLFDPCVNTCEDGKPHEYVSMSVSQSEPRLAPHATVLRCAQCNQSLSIRAYRATDAKNARKDAQAGS